MLIPSIKPNEFWYEIYTINPFTKMPETVYSTIPTIDIDEQKKAYEKVNDEIRRLRRLNPFTEYKIDHWAGNGVKATNLGTILEAKREDMKRP